MRWLSYSLVTISKNLLGRLPYFVTKVSIGSEEKCTFSYPCARSLPSRRLTFDVLASHFVIPAQAGIQQFQALVTGPTQDGAN